MPASTHFDFLKQPNHGNIKLWRYMDFTKFVSLISSSSLYFSRADKFQDPYEGTLPIYNESLKDIIYGLVPESERERLIKESKIFKDVMRQRTYINCWHENEFESAAMWDLYGKNNDSIAIETTYSKLKDSLTDEFCLGMVNYIDYKSMHVPENNIVSPFMHKRVSFKHEQEVRALIIKFPEEGDGPIHLYKDNMPAGTSVQVNLNELINYIHIAPTASPWFYELVKTVAGHYDISAKIMKSDLYESPIH